MTKPQTKSSLSNSVIDECLGLQCSKITLGLMKNCGEPFTLDTIGSGLAITWGITFHYNNKQFSVTWAEDSKIGDPCYISIVNSSYFNNIDSYIEQSVRSDSPLFKFISSKLISYEIHEYETNYPGDKIPIRKMPWSIELRYSRGQILIGALSHERVASECLCADELVVLYDENIISKIKTRCNIYQSIWQSEKDSI